MEQCKTELENAYSSTAQNHNIGCYDAAVTALHGTVMKLLIPGDIPGETGKRQLSQLSETRQSFLMKPKHYAYQTCLFWEQQFLMLAVVCYVRN